MPSVSSRRRPVSKKPELVSLVALGNYSYARRPLRFGDSFVAIPAHARLLVLAKRAPLVWQASHSLGVPLKTPPMWQLSQRWF